MASANSQKGTDKRHYGGHNSAVTHSSVVNMEDTRSDDKVVPIGVVTQCSQSTENVYNDGQHQNPVWVRHSGYYTEITGYRGMIGIFHHSSMIAAAKQVQHDHHWAGTDFITVSPGEELYWARRPKERPPILQHQLTTMQRLFPTKDRRVVILKSVLVPNGLPVPRALLFKECCFQLVIGTSLLGQRQQNEHNLFIQAEREEVCLFRQHNWCANTGG